MTERDDMPSLSRRGLLAACLAATSSGCLQRARSLVNRQSPERVSVTIKTVPADDDEAAVKIARCLEEHMRAVGIDASIELEAESTFLRDVLLNNDFDVYVGRFPPRRDPDFLRATLHSEFVSEPGWQNPFGVSDLEIDEFASTQRTTQGHQRKRAVSDLALEAARKQPFDVVCFPEEIVVYRTDRYTNWPAGRLEDPLTYLSLDRRTDGSASKASGADGSGTDGEPTRFRLALTDARVTRNLNPIAVEYRRRGTIVDLVYDSLARRQGDIKPWLATDVDWSDDGGTAATVSLREGASWHDGEAVTADDVAFTYRFYHDTTMGNREMAVPTPRFRGRTSLVESVERLDERTVRLTFGETSEGVAERALTVPILPEHVWRDRTDTADIVGVDVSTSVTDALVWSNAEPIGSGPLTFDSRTPDETLVLSRFEDHFLADDPPSWFDSGPAFEELVVRIAPSDRAAAALVAEGEADLTGGEIKPEATEIVGDVADVEVQHTTSRSFYHVGFNNRRDPFGNVRFRRAIARLLDAENVVETIFDGHATPAATPLSGTEWVPPDLEWSGSDPEVPFFGSDGDLEVAAAKRALEDAGYRFENDHLVR